MDVVGQGWEVMRPAGSGADLAACWRRWVEDALGGKLLLLVLCAVVASLAPPWQAELLSSAFLAPPAPPRGAWVRSHSLVLGSSKFIARMLPCLTTLSREGSLAVVLEWSDEACLLCCSPGRLHGCQMIPCRKRILSPCLPRLERARLDGRKSPLAKEKAGGRKARGWD